MNTHTRESGQVLLVGIVMIVIILVSLFVLADVHNTIRAKLKLETAQQAAAIAAAEWQRESLNLIGEINLIKASNALLQPPDKIDIMQLEYDRLTEMQTRVSFLGPLIGFAAAQQAAKANGINSHGNLNEIYLKYLTEDNGYYFSAGSDGYINNYKWFRPYRELVETISNSGIAIRPNVGNSFSLTAYPYCLNSTSFYRDIYYHYNDINQNPTYQREWLGTIVSMCKLPDSYYRNTWWDIRFHTPKFIGQSEIYPLYVNIEDPLSPTDDEKLVINDSPIRGNLLPTAAEYPEIQNIRMKWYCYDQKNWDTEAYRNFYNPNPENDDSHHYNWYNGEYVLRSKIKEQYRYEGPVAYAETGLRISHLSKYVKPGTSRKNFFKTNTPIEASTVIGAERVLNEEKNIDLTSRPGVMAKTFGELKNGKKPHTVRMVLPVFHTTSVVPTYFPRPYDFAILHEPNQLELFLVWLSSQTDLTGTPPEGTDWYLKALQILSDGPGFRYYCWNPNFDADAFNDRWKDKWHEYYEERNTNPQSYVYDQQQNPSGPGWLQEPRRYGPDRERKIRRGEIQTDYCREHTNRPVTLVGIAKNTFYVIDYKGKVITNADHDPLKEPYGNTCSGSCCCGNCQKNDFYVPDKINRKPGPPRL